MLKDAAKNYMADTPYWAKVIRLIGIVAGATGGAIMMSNPITFPAAVVAAAPYLTFIGNLTALIVQRWKK